LISILIDLEIEFDELNLKDNDSMIDLDIVDDTISVDEVSEDDSDSGYDNLFLEEHPQYQTHWIEFKDQNKNVVPNFVGGSLARISKAKFSLGMRPLKSTTSQPDNCNSWATSICDMSAMMPEMIMLLSSKRNLILLEVYFHTG